MKIKLSGKSRLGNSAVAKFGEDWIIMDKRFFGRNMFAEGNGYYYYVKPDQPTRGIGSRWIKSQDNVDFDIVEM